jgi:hypothetical protein
MEMLMGRHDYYQTSTHLIAAVYLKGYAAEGVKEQVEVKFDSGSVCIFIQDLVDMADVEGGDQST